LEAIVGRPSFDSIGEAEIIWLERDFEEGEVLEVVKAMNADKVPGPGGYALAFFQACWVVLKEDIMKVFCDFHARGKFERSLNATFIALILKISVSVDIKDFRPISLVSGIRKSIAKILANMLKMVLEKIISKSQNAFIRGRQMLDPILIASECLDSRIRFGKPGVLCKMDLEKAYDHVDWDFMMYMLRRCWFGRKWCSWIAHCISSVRFSVLVNGTPTGLFNSSPSLRQGDPLSLLLFVLMMEDLDGVISAAVSGVLLSGFYVGTWNVGGIDISHLLFSDDTLIFCWADLDHLRHLRCLFLCF
jgi:hypothetical protein